jgi:solute carrier family 25 (mitochondrial citrate transporter), member 1
MNYNGNKSYQTYISGGLSGVASLVFIYPTEYLKSQVQFRGNQKTTMELIRHTYSRWGLRGFYHGMSPLFIASAPRSMFKFVGYEIIHYEMRKRGWLEESPHARNFIAGAAAGFMTAGGVSSLTDNIKMKGIYDQTQNGQKKTMRESAKTIWKEKGIRGFYRGLSSTGLKEAMTFGLRFFFYHPIFTQLHALEAEWKQTHPDELQKNPLTSAVAGGISGGLVCLINNPFDVTQTRMQTNYQGQYKNLAHCIWTILREEGVQTFWKGAGYRSLRAVPGVMISFGVYEGLYKIFHSCSN